MAKTDRDLVLSVLNGNGEPFDELMNRHSGRIAVLCWTKTAGRGPIEDLVQETLFRGLRALKTLDEPERFGAWLRGIASRVCADWSRSKQRDDISIESLPERSLPGLMSDRSAEQREREREVWKSICGLPEIYRETLLLFYYEGMRYRALAQTLGVTEATVNARLAKARNLLRERLSEVE